MKNKTYRTADAVRHEKPVKLNASSDNYESGEPRKINEPCEINEVVREAQLLKVW